MTRTDALALALALGAAACDARLAPAPPRPLAVVPAVGFTSGAADVEISGESFEVRPVQSVSKGSSEVEAGYRAWLGAVELTDVSWVDRQTIRGRVPPGLALGTHDLAVEGPFGRGVRAGAYQVIAGTPAAIGVSIASPAGAGLGEDVDVAVTVANLGEALVTSVRPELAASGEGAVTLVATPGPQDVPAGAARTFVWRARASRAGEVALSAIAGGTDSRTGAAVSGTASSALLVDARSAVTLTISLPALPFPLGEFPATVTLANVGAATATAVAIPPPTVIDASTASAVLVAAPSVAASLAPGEARTFTWTFRAVASGWLELDASASWRDESGVTHTAGGRSSRAFVQELAGVVAENPLGFLGEPLADVSKFAFVAPYRGDVWIGPNRKGTLLARVPLDGSAPEKVTLSFGKDRVGNVASNGSTAPYTSIGYTGCSPDGSCGPDDEDGRGLLTSVAFADDEWLVLGGARSGGELDYVYLSRASTASTVPAAPLFFSYVDVGGLLGAATRGFTAAQVAGGRLYLGFADNGGSRPYGLALLAAPPSPSTWPGLDAIEGTHALELGLHTAYDGAYHMFTTISMVDAIAELNGHVYFFGGSGCLASRTAQPRWSGDFVPCSPADDVDYDPWESIAPSRQFDLEPRDRAWPQVVAWNGRLFAIRNATAGPQLWSCDPARRGDPTLCDRSDWSLVAAGAGYRTQLAPTASAATLLVATSTHLFVGFDDDAGLHVFRTRVADPWTASDFTGSNGCVAGTAGCQGLGGDGVGRGLTRIFDAKAVSTPEGRTDVFLTAGTGSGPVHLVRMAP